MERFVFYQSISLGIKTASQFPCTYKSCTVYNGRYSYERAFLSDCQNFHWAINAPRRRMTLRPETIILEPPHWQGYPRAPYEAIYAHSMLYMLPSEFLLKLTQKKTASNSVSNLDQVIFF